MNSITVIVPPEKFDGKVYDSNTDCYIARALRAMGYKDVLVGGVTADINGKEYKSEQQFDHTAVKEHFDRGELLILTFYRL